MNEEEGTLDKRKRLYPDYKKNRSKNRPKFKKDAEGNTLTNSPGQTFTRGEQVQGPDDFDMRTGAPIYESLAEIASTPKPIRGSTSFDDETRFQEQLNTIKKVVDPTDPAFMSELLLDLKTGYSAAKSAPGGPLIKGGAAMGAVAFRRLLDDIIVPRVTKTVTPEGLEMPMMMMSKGKGSQKGVRFGSKGFGSLDDVDDLDEFLLSKSIRYY